MNLPRASIIFLLLITVWSFNVGTSRADEHLELLFEDHIQEVFKAKCGKCHSRNVRKGDLDLSTIAAIRTGGESGEPLIGEEKPAEGYLWEMIDGEAMPPDGEPQLSDEEKSAIHRWLLSGARSRAGDDQPKPLTQHDVLPIVLLRCTTCHGARIKEAGVDLRTPAAMKRGGKNGPALLPGDPDGSLMIQRIESEACPPREKLLKFFVRRPSASEVEKLRRWIEEGAQEFDIRPDVATSEPDPLVTEEDRQHWAFQPPNVRGTASSIDEFIEAKLSHAGLKFSPEADRDTLIRRASFDLIGMPPSVDDWTRWRTDNASDWYSRMIDELLAAPHYGERWGRYWLDVAGYADSEGGVSADPVRKVAWKYRDYVIRSFNADKPYDRLLLEQIAGDELVDYKNAPEITEEIVENLIATGFLRMGIDQTGSRTMNFVPERLGVIGDAISVVGSGVMGLTLECARCHSHKYDPLPQRDYYRFKAVFQGALDEHDWLTFKNRNLDVAIASHRREIKAINPPIAKQIKQLEAQRKKAVAESQLALLRHVYPRQSTADQDATLKALRIADNNRTLVQRNLVEMLQKAEVLADSELSDDVLASRKTIETITDEIETLKRSMVPPSTIRALWDRGEPSPTYVLRRGDHDKPGPLVGPGVPSVLTNGRTPFAAAPPFPGGTPRTGRRLAFARWLVSPDNPLTARVIINRIWYHHFGRGLVTTLENFGVQGERPTHPKLLDWLAVNFIENGWSIKQMHRLIMTSRTYRQQSVVSEEAVKADPANQLWSRMELRRIDAEALRDSLLFVAGKLDTTFGGLPDPIRVDRSGEVRVKQFSDRGWRRSIYSQYRRTEIPSMMATFDYPEMGPNCVSRSVSTVSPQSLMLLNNEEVRQLASDFAKRVDAACPEPLTSSKSFEHHILAAYRIAFSRDPTPDELKLALTSLEELVVAWNGDRQLALESFCHTLLNSAEFLYVD